MAKKNYLEPLKSVLGRSILHYSNSQGFVRGKQEVNSGSESIRQEVKGENHRQCSNIRKTFSYSHGIHFDPYCEKYVWNYFLWLVFYAFQWYACESWLFFLFKDLLDHKSWLLNSMDVSQVTIVRSSCQWRFVTKDCFSSKSFSWIVWLNCTSKGVASPIFSKNNLFQGHGDSICLWN